MNAGIQDSGDDVIEFLRPEYISVPVGCDGDEPLTIKVTCRDSVQITVREAKMLNSAFGDAQKHTTRKAVTGDEILKCVKIIANFRDAFFAGPERRKMELKFLREGLNSFRAVAHWVISIHKFPQFDHIYNTAQLWDEVLPTALQLEGDIAHVLRVVESAAEPKDDINPRDYIVREISPVYEAITGKKAASTPTGPFASFVKAIYEIAFPLDQADAPYTPKPDGNFEHNIKSVKKKYAPLPNVPGFSFGGIIDEHGSGWQAQKDLVRQVEMFWCMYDGVTDKIKFLLLDGNIDAAAETVGRIIYGARGIGAIAIVEVARRLEVDIRRQPFNFPDATLFVFQEALEASLTSLRSTGVFDL